ncbi:MAG: hypothetical protein O7G86_14985 [Gammaproteobacteria bacterium]|nr:hypothetical protein [Gammaproteobacteria bacterium]
MYHLAFRAKSCRLVENIDSESGWRSELAEPVSLGLRLLSVKLSLKLKALFFEGVDRMAHG